MTALVRMRLTGFTVTGRGLAPILTVLVVLATSYGGGKAQPGEAYGFSALVLFPVLAWQTKLLLDAEPDVQRRLVAVASGSGWRELAAGLFAAATAALPTLAVALILPWVLGGLRGPVNPDDLPLSDGVALGIWALVLVVPSSVALGALSSRAITRNVGFGVATLVGGAVLAIVLGVDGSPAPWLAPPLMAVARRCNLGASAIDVFLLTCWAVLWSAAAFTLYIRLRRTSRG